MVCINCCRRRWVPSRCIASHIYFFSVKTPDRVILDETKPDQVRLHLAVFMAFHVLTVRTQTYGCHPIQTLTVSFRSGNKLPHMNQVLRFQSQHLVHPFGPVVHTCKPYSTSNDKAVLQRNSRREENRSRAKEIAVFSLLHEKVDLDLDLEPQMIKKSDKWGLESVYLSFAVSSFNKTRAKLLPLNFAQFLGFCSSKP